MFCTSGATRLTVKQTQEAPPPQGEPEGSVADTDPEKHMKMKSNCYIQQQYVLKHVKHCGMIFPCSGGVLCSYTSSFLGLPWDVGHAATWPRGISFDLTQQRTLQIIM